MISFELGILDYLQEVFHSDILDFLMPLVTKLGDHGIIPIIFCSFLLIIPTYRKLGIPMALGMALCFIMINLTLKPFVARERPFTYLDYQLLISTPTDYSFPSGHSGILAAVSSSLFYSKSRFRYLAIAIALIVAFSRLYLYVHFPSDVLAGIIIGWIAGYSGNTIYRKLKKPTMTDS